LIEIELVGTLPVATKNVARALDEAGAYMVKSIQDNFDESGRPKWKPTKWGNKPLKGNTGALYDSGKYSVSGTEVTVSWGAGLPIYPWVQQFGAEIKVTEQMKKFFWAKYFNSGEEFWKFMALKKVGSTITIPPRPYVMFQDADIDYIMGLFAHYAIEFEGTSESVGVNYGRGIAAGLE
jgi:phage gpG-like protein